MNTTELKSAMLEVLDDPTECRIIVETKIPSLSNNLDPLYFMIDRRDDQWFISNSAGEGYEAENNICLIAFFASIPGEAIARVYVDSF